MVTLSPLPYDTPVRANDSITKTEKMLPNSLMITSCDDVIKSNYHFSKEYPVAVKFTNYVTINSHPVFIPLNQLSGQF
jgi:hypothetical protein